jgi:hypothetical protein
MHKQAAYIEAQRQANLTGQPVHVLHSARVYIIASASRVCGPSWRPAQLFEPTQTPCVHLADGSLCCELFNCCDCGDTSGDGCGCAYCWSCNACDACLSDD